ncbi:MAG: DNA-directed RNA polymerase subunit beta [Chloroflexota bacterium]
MMEEVSTPVFITNHQRLSYARISDVLQMPNLIQVQRDSFEWFKEEGLRELLDEISPIQSFSKDLELYFLDYSFGEPKYSEAECRQRDMTFSVPLKVWVRLVNKKSGEIKEQEIFMGDFPKMTDNGTFVINGAERVVVSQLVRSPGVYFTTEEDPSSGRHLCYGKLIPNRGAWLEFETSNKDVLSVKVDRKRKIPVTTLLRAIGYGSDEELLALFRDVDTNPDHPYLLRTIDKEPIDARTQNGAVIEFYKRLRPGDPPTLDNAREFLENLFFRPRRYALGRVGRYKINKRLGLPVPMSIRTLTREDLVKIVEFIVRVNNGVEASDDIDHLGNRRVRAVGELIQNQFRVGLLRMERLVKERMSIQDPEQVTPGLLINIRPVVAAMREFFGGSQLSQFMDQTNPLAELTHKRRLSALGPGGLSRERAGFDVRDVHNSHYGRICPIETPEGPNIGLIGSLATYARINEYGFIETPYRKVTSSVDNTYEAVLGKTLGEDVVDPRSGEVMAEKGVKVTPELAERLSALPPRRIKIVPMVTNEIVYLSADEEEQYAIAQANAPLNEDGQFVEERVSARHGKKFLFELRERVDYMDVSPKQIVSVATALIPFLEHDDANRALMGSNMQRQAVPLLVPEPPIVGTGVEVQAAKDSGQVIVAQKHGVATSVTADSIALQYDDGTQAVCRLEKFVRSNQGTCVDQRPAISKGQRVQPGQVIADSSSTANGELALGQNVIVAFLSWEGGNYEDAMLISENLVREDKFTSIHIEKHEIEARDTKLGPEEITRDIPNVSEDSLRNLDEDGIVRLGAEVGPGDILVGKITPKGETDLTAEEKLLRAIFGEKAREVKDTSLRVPHGEKGKVVDIKVFSRQDHDELPAGVNKLVRVSIAQKRKVSEGDKMAGRHGNKGVISKVLPVEDMPFLPDGTPVDLILSPIGVPSRMNVGQILETHLGWAARELDIRVISPVFDGATEQEIEGALARAWLEQRGFSVECSEGSLKDKAANLAAIRLCLREWLRENGVEVDQVADGDVENVAAEMSLTWGLPMPILGKVQLYDGRTGAPFDQPVTVGNIYMMKLAHLVEDKIHARSTGPYSLVTQQPLGGKAQFGGQRFGEMEVWALEAYGSSHILQEMLTVKSDDVIGRVKTYEAIVKGENILEPGVPESFKVLVKELQSLGLAVEVLNEDEERIQFAEEAGEEPPSLGLEGINLIGFE